MDSSELELSVSQFVALFNQTMDIAYPNVTVVGELANFRISRNRWVYFDLKDDTSTIKFFGTVYQLPGPLEEGLILRVKGQPRLHNLYGFSINVLSMQPAGEGSIKKAANLLKEQLIKEGLFNEDRKRSLPYPPERIGLITSKQSAAYADFIKVTGARWNGLEIDLIDTQVQGEIAPQQISAAIKQFNASPNPPEVLVIIRGGGSAEDLFAFSTEEVTRAVASSRVPTLVAIGHEIDISLAELAADVRASTPSNAAETLVPDRASYKRELNIFKLETSRLVQSYLNQSRSGLKEASTSIFKELSRQINDSRFNLINNAKLIEALNPEAILRRGYSIVKSKDKLIRSVNDINEGSVVDVQLYKGKFKASVKSINS